MIVIGFAHGVLLWAGDIVGAYGLLAVLMAGCWCAPPTARCSPPPASASW
jgi:hypothetical protein